MRVKEGAIDGSYHRPATTCRRTGRWASASGSGSKPVFGRGNVFASYMLLGAWSVQERTRLKHAPQVALVTSLLSDLCGTATVGYERVGSMPHRPTSDGCTR